MNAAVRIPEEIPAHAQDWHREDITCELRKRGWTWARIGRATGYARPDDVLRRKWAAMERIVADLLGTEPWVIWPSRYGPGRIFRRHRPRRRKE